MFSQDELRRRQMMQEALTRGLQRPRSDDPFSIGNANVQRALLGQRQPWDERTPDGRNVQDLIAKRPAITMPTAPTGLTLPQPSQPNPNINLESIQPPRPSEPTAAPSTPRVGYSTAGLTGLDALQQRRKALEEADPESKVTDTGEILPPKKTGRLRGAGQLALLGLGQGDPDRPLYSLGQMIGGAVTGAVSPRSAAKAQRQFDLSRLDNDIARGLKLEGAQAELDRMKNPVGSMSTRVVTEGEYPGVEAGTEIRVRVDPRTGAVTDVVGPNQKPVIADLAKRPSAGAPHYEKDADGYLITVQGGRAQRVTDENGKPVQVKRSGEEEYVEVEVNGRKMRVTPGQALDYYGAIGAREDKQNTEQAERQAKWQAASNDYQSLLIEEEAARKEKDRAYKVLSDMRDVTPDDERGRQDIAQATKAAQEAETAYKSYADKKREAQRRMQENQVSATPTRSQPYAGRTMSRANLERYAKDKGLSVEEARKEVEGMGVRVQ